MTKIAFYLLTFTLLGTACQETRKEAPVAEVHPHIDLTTLPHLPDSMLQERRQQVKAELEYYLSRHKVGEEGFDMVARYAQQGDSLLRTYAPRNIVSSASMFKWRGVARHGTGIYHDHLGHFILGHWQADTLVYGLCIDATSIYSGQFDQHMQPHGHGSLRTADGTYFEGHFQHGLREGFGFSISTQNLLAGIWKNNRFLGERFMYNTDRIYGIDISRYQHEQGRKRYSINWQHMNISHLGKRVQHNVSGTSEFPVSFAYIKATEGISIRNRYFLSDYNTARRKGIHVGAYHFFSTKQDAKTQAYHFLKQACFKHGDLPPMLDIEPSDALIQKMGGTQALFHAIRTWTDIVQKRTGTRPILYVNQRFVRKYLNEAPDLKRDYQFWIARYSEYKPDVHMVLWQLSADGHVQGIHGPVDINVFNGYEGQWDEFLRDETIP